jgi:DNA-binding transcriptional ArsR family regulator
MGNVERKFRGFNELMRIDVSPDGRRDDTNSPVRQRGPVNTEAPRVANQPGRNGTQYLQEVADVMRHLSDGTRLRILMVLAAREEQNVNQLCEALGAPQPAVSHHLGILRRAHLVRARRQGREIHYRLDGSASAAGPSALRVSVGGTALLIDTARRAGGKGASLFLAATLAAKAVALG